MSDILRFPGDTGRAIRDLRSAKGLGATELARKAGRSRDTLHRLERGEDVSLSTFLAFAASLGCAITLVQAGMPTLDEMARRFASDDDDD